MNSHRFIAFVMVALFGLAAHAAAPTVRNVSLRGLQIGGPTTIVIDGVDLLPNPRLFMSIPIAAQTVKTTATATRVEFDVTLDDKAAPGLYNLYLATDGGVSEKNVVALDRLPQRPFAATIESLPIALHGALGGSAVLKTTFAGQAGQAIICEVESQRLGAKVRPVLHLYDADGKHLSWSLPSQSLRGDARLIATLPAVGQYTLTLNDLQYAAPGPNHFRLKIGQWQFADLAFPSAVQRGTSAAIHLIGSAPADKSSTLAANLETSHLPATWLDAATSSGPAPAVLLSGMPELIEAAPAEAVQEIPAISAGVNGRLALAKEEDRYRPKVQPDSKLRFELFSARLGSPLDTVLELRRETGVALATNDDAPGTTDSALDFTVPKDVETLLVAVKDVHGRGGESCIYRLQVTNTQAPPTPDFRLTVEQDKYNVPANGRQVVRLRADRQGYQGSIRVAFGQLPPGITVEGAEIPAGAGGKLITLTGSGEALSQFATSIRGVAAAEPNPSLTRVARSEPDAVGQFQPWLADEIALALASRGGNLFDCDWQPATDAKLVLGGKLQVQVKCVRPAGFDGAVRLTLLTSQNPPQVNGKDDPNRTLRAESAGPFEILVDAKAVAAWDAKLAADKVAADALVPQAAAVKALADAQTAGAAAIEAATKAKADADAKVADAQQKQAAANEAAVAAAAAAKNDVNYVALVPADLPAAPVEIAFRAELLSRDKQRVLLTVCTPVRVLPAFNPLKLSYTGPPKASTKLDAKTGASVKLAGKIERLEGLTGDVSVSVVGLPAGVAAPKITIKADQTDYELELKFPANVPPGELKDVKLFATGKTTPQTPLETKSEEVPVLIELLPPDV